MHETPKITSTELASLWLTYQQKTMSIQMFSYFIAKSNDEASKAIMQGLIDQVQPIVEKITSIFVSEGAVLPMGFGAADVNKDAKPLFENGFDLFFTRLMKQVSSGMHTLHLGRTYRDDIQQIFQELTTITQSVQISSTQYLLDKGMLSRSPYVAMPEKVTFASGKDYMSGINPFKEKRSLNVVEIAQIYHGIETNIVGMNLINGFHQVAKDADVKKFFAKGLELSKKIIHEFSDVLIKDNLQVPASPGGNITKSIEAPFSDKLMLYCTSVLCSFSLGSNAIGTAFSMRSDLPPLMLMLGKDVLTYATEGARLMIEKGWLEEPPQI